jgi:multidrug efflux pump subunit AcrA (membrane-fusion protein)
MAGRALRPCRAHGTVVTALRLLARHDAWAAAQTQVRVLRAAQLALVLAPRAHAPAALADLPWRWLATLAAARREVRVGVRVVPADGPLPQPMPRVVAEWLAAALAAVSVAAGAMVSAAEAGLPLAVSAADGADATAPAAGVVGRVGA